MSATPIDRGVCSKCGIDFRNSRKVAGQVRYSKCCTEAERFWERVRKTEGCWLYTGAHNQTGYGVVATKEGFKRAHRYSYELANGPIPKGMHVLHSCDVRDCVRPDHLRLGTHDENMVDMTVRGRRPAGEKTKRNRLTEADVRAILANPPIPGKVGSVKAVAKKYGVHVGAIRAILVGHTWKHLPRVKCAAMSKKGA